MGHSAAETFFSTNDFLLSNLAAAWRPVWTTRHLCLMRRMRAGWRRGTLTVNFTTEAETECQPTSQQSSHPSRYLRNSLKTISTHTPFLVTVCKVNVKYRLILFFSWAQFWSPLVCQGIFKLTSQIMVARTGVVNVPPWYCHHHHHHHHQDLISTEYSAAYGGYDPGVGGGAGSLPPSDSQTSLHSASQLSMTR